MIQLKPKQNWKVTVLNELQSLLSQVAVQL